jgi:polyhydroxyalkanoate synthesis regulator phasin
MTDNEFTKYYGMTFDQANEVLNNIKEENASAINQIMENLEIAEKSRTVVSCMEFFTRLDRLKRELTKLRNGVVK